MWRVMPSWRSEHIFVFELALLFVCSSGHRASKIAGAGTIESLDDAPGGGQMLTITDPEGFPINLICDQDTVPTSDSPKPEKMVYNFEDQKTRKNKFQRFTEGPAAVYKVRPLPVSVKW